MLKLTEWRTEKPAQRLFGSLSQASLCWPQGGPVFCKGEQRTGEGLQCRADRGVSRVASLPSQEKAHEIQAIPTQN